MEKKVTKSMKTIKKQFIKYVSLNILSTMGLAFYILVDTFFIANGCGSDGLAALNIALPVYGFMFAMAVMLGVGSGTRFKIAYKDYQKKCEIFTKGLSFVSIISAFFFLLGVFFAKDISYILGARGEVLNLTSTYIRVILIFAPAFLINNLLISFIRNDNNPALAMIAVTVGSVLNVVFDYIFIYPMGMGMLGAALATGASPVIGIIIQTRHFIKGKNTFKLSKTKIKIKDFFFLSSLGISSLINELSSSIVIMVFNFILLKYSSQIGVAAYGVVANIALVVIAVFNGIGQGIQPIISEYYSKKDTKSTTYILKSAIILGFTIAMILYVYMYFNADTLQGFFNAEKNETLKNMARQGIHIYFLAMPFSALNIIIATSMQAMEKPRISFVISILRGIVLIVPLALIMSKFMHIKGMWYSYVLTEFVVSILSVLMTLEYGKLVKR